MVVRITKMMMTISRYHQENQEAAKAVGVFDPVLRAKMGRRNHLKLEELGQSRMMAAMMEKIHLKSEEEEATAAGRVLTARAPKHLHHRTDPGGARALPVGVSFKLVMELRLILAVVKHDLGGME